MGSLELTNALDAFVVAGDDSPLTIRVRVQPGREGVIDDVTFTDADTLVSIRFDDGRIETYPTDTVTLVGRVIPPRRDHGGITYNDDGTIRNGHHRAFAIAKIAGRPMPRTREDVELALTTAIQRTPAMIARTRAALGLPVLKPRPHYKVGDVVALPPEPPVGTILSGVGHPATPDSSYEIVRRQRGWYIVAPPGGTDAGPSDWRDIFHDWNECQPLTVVSAGGDE
jgi:hypothetical protein